MHIYKIEDPGGSPKFRRVYHSYDDKGDSYEQNDSAGIGVGDIDGDGRDEICLVYAHTPATRQAARSYFSAYEYDGTDGDDMKLRELFRDEQYSSDDDNREQKVYDVLEERDDREDGFSIGSFEVEVVDLDGDNRAEFIWSCVTSYGDQDDLNIWIHSWPSGSVTDLGNHSRYKLSRMSEANNMGVDPDFSCYSMAAGYFDLPETIVGASIPMQIAVSWMNGDALCWAVCAWTPQNGLDVLGQGRKTGVLKNNGPDQIRPQMTAADLARDSYVLGEPAGIRVLGNVELEYVIQAPPTHLDLVSGDIGGTIDANGSSYADAFFDLKGYATKFKTSVTAASIDQTTETSNYSIGGGGKVGVTVPRLIKNQPPYFSGQFGLNYMYQSIHETTRGNTYKTSMSTTTSAHYDDQLYYTKRDYTIWRYPVLFPLSERMMPVSDDEGNDTMAQQFIQFVVPESSSNKSGLSAPGRSIAWYEPLYDNTNLFTYPVKLDDIVGYPQGQESKEEDDPWFGVNGASLKAMEEQWIGNPDATDNDITISQEIIDRELKQWKNTLSGSLGGEVNIKVPFASIVTNIGLNVKGDGVWGTATTTTTSASSMNGVTIAWPKGFVYKSRSGLAPNDLQFMTDIGIYKQDDGALCVGYAIGELKNNSALLWSARSIYAQMPDPGLLLPFRFNRDGSYNKTYKSHLIRGMAFSEQGRVIEPGMSDIPGKAFTISTPFKGSFRVINYSFVDSAPLKAIVSFQPIEDADEAPDITKAVVPVDELALNGVKGRSNIPTERNWKDVTFLWTTPAETGLGYLHVELQYDGEELNGDNNRGYVLTGCYDPEDLSPDIKPPKMASAVWNDDLELVIESVEAYMEDGSPLDLSLGLPSEESIELVCVVRFDAPAGTKIKGLPFVRLYLMADDALAAGEALPFLKTGGKWTARMMYDSSESGGAMKNLRLEAVSDALLRLEASSGSVYNLPVGSGYEGGSSSGGGCGAGMGIAALLAAFLHRRTRK